MASDENELRPGRNGGLRSLIIPKEGLLKKVLFACTIVAALSLSATAVAALSPAAYRAKVNAICATGVAALKAIPQPKTASAILPYFQKAVAMGDKLVLKIAAVTPPLSLQPSVGHAIDLQVAYEKALHKLVARLQTSKNPVQTVTAAEASLNSLNNKANVAWRKAGLTKCA